METMTDRGEAFRGGGVIFEIFHATAEAAAGVAKEVVHESLPEELQESYDMFEKHWKFRETVPDHLQISREDTAALSEVRKQLAALTGDNTQEESHIAFVHVPAGADPSSPIEPRP